jgi:hypothetical protein
MYRLIHPVILLLLASLVSGCASMSKKDCENADWHAIGYNDGARGIQPGHLNVYSQRCAEYKIAPDAGAYQAGWDQGIRSYCTSTTGYNTGAAGLAYSNICPADVAPAFLAGYRQGLDQYCTPDNGLQQGLRGYPYRGVCPADMAAGFQQRYQLGLDLRRARAAHQNAEYRLGQVRQALATEKDPDRYHDLLNDLVRLRYEDEHSEAMVAALNACAGNDWYEAGLSDGEAGQPYRASEIAGICQGYGSPADDIGYRQGWRDGNSHYCTYDSGVYAGQGNEEYRGVCHGPAYLLFWGGYLQGLGLFRSGRYEDHPRPTYPHAERHRHEERIPAPEQHFGQPEQPRRRTVQSRPEHRSMNPPAREDQRSQPAQPMRHRATSPEQSVAAPQPGHVQRQQEAKPQQAGLEQKGEETSQQLKQQNGQTKAKTKRRETQKARRRTHSED